MGLAGEIDSIKQRLAKIEAFLFDDENEPSLPIPKIPYEQIQELNAEAWREPTSYYYVYCSRGDKFKYLAVFDDPNNPVWANDKRQAKRLSAEDALGLAANLVGKAPPNFSIPHAAKGS